MTSRDLRLILTKSCNYRCTFCHQEGVSHELAQVLDNQDYLFLYDIVQKRQQIEGVTLTGGEPLMYNQILPLSKMLHDHGAKITMVTNGSLLDKHPEVGQRLNRINVSLHTLDQDQYTNITQTRNKIDHVLANIGLMKKLHPNLIIRLNATIVKGRNDNLQDIAAMVAVADQYGLSIKFVELYPKTDPGFFPISSVELLLEELNFEKHIDKPRQKVFQRGKRTIVLTKIFCGAAEEQQDPEAFCREENDLFVTPDGRVSPCPVDIQKISIYDAIKQRNSKEIEHLVDQAIDEVQSSCIYNSVENEAL